MAIFHLFLWLSSAVTWMDPENIMASEISQMKKDKNHTVSLMPDIKLKTN